MFDCIIHPIVGDMSLQVWMKIPRNIFLVDPGIHSLSALAKRTVKAVWHDIDFDETSLLAVFHNIRRVFAPYWQTSTPRTFRRDCCAVKCSNDKYIFSFPKRLIEKNYCVLLCTCSVYNVKNDETECVFIRWTFKDL